MVDVYSCMVFVCMHVHAWGASGRQQSIHELLCVQIYQSIHVSLSVYSSYIVSILECECVITYRFMYSICPQHGVTLPSLPSLHCVCIEYTMWPYQYMGQ